MTKLFLLAAMVAMTVVALLGSSVPAGASSVPSIAGRSAAVSPEPVGLWEPGNSGVYSLPGVTTAYDIQYYGWYEGFQTGNWIGSAARCRFAGTRCGMLWRLGGALFSTGAVDVSGCMRRSPAAG